MKYTATLGGQKLKSGSLQEVQDAVMEAMTGFLAEDPEGVATIARTANRAFQDGTVEASVASTGSWVLTPQVRGSTKILEVTKKGWF